MIDYRTIPTHMQDAARRYIEDGIMPGSFLEAVLANDLLGAITRADHINRALLSSYHDFLVTIPMSAKGSYEAVHMWCKHNGMRGL